MKLTGLAAAQTKWLLHARSAGYDRGFRARYNRALGRLEALGYVERNPTSPGHWRVTASGLVVRVMKPLEALKTAFGR
jgi:hypothetical protein